MLSIKKIQFKYTQINPLDLNLLLSHVLKKPKEFIFAHPEHKLDLIEKIKLYCYLFLYRQNFPIAYITHHKEFFGLNFYINKYTLIPRPETELMVEEAAKSIRYKVSDIKGNILLIDVGTGTGCIPIAIMKTFPPQADQPQAEKHENMKVVATDISSHALKVARKNATVHKVDIQFLRGNLLEPVLPIIQRYALHASRYKIIITANLPYLTQEQFTAEPSIQKEPYNALVAKKKGLDLYEKLLEQIKTLHVMRYTLCAFFEIDPSQTESIIALIKKSLPSSHIIIKQDLAGRDRLVIVEN